MTIIGIILAIVGAGGFVLEITGAGANIAQFASLPVPLWGWIAVFGIGVALLILNRRPGD